MRKPEIINVLKDPSVLQPGDIIGFNQFPGHSKTQVKGSSGLPLTQFNATVQEPSFRGFVLGITYDGDIPKAISIMAMAPILKSQHIPNDDKNRMIAKRSQVEVMGLSTDKDWRLNLMPITLDITPRNFGHSDEGKIVRFGTTDNALKASILGQVEKLFHQGILHSANFLPEDTARQLKGRATANYGIIAGVETRVAVQGNARDAAAVAEAAERAARERNAARKIAKADAARTVRNEMRASPSGKIAYETGLRFNEKFNPDISLDSALELGLIDTDTLLAVDDIGFKTLRTAFDGFRSDHAGVLEKLANTRLMEGREEELKAGLEFTLKNALTEFYRQVQNPNYKKNEELQKHITAYKPAPVATVQEKAAVPVPATAPSPPARKPEAKPQPRDFAAMSLSEALKKDVISSLTNEFLKDAVVPRTGKAPNTLGEAYEIVIQAPDSLRSIFGLQSANSVIRARIIEEVKAPFIKPPEPS